MSHNSKNARLHHEARERSKNRQSGSKGPKVNSAKPGTKTYRCNPDGSQREDRRKAMSEFLAAINDRIAKRWGSMKAPTI